MRAIVRALIKYSAKEAAEKAGNKQDKLLGAILGAAVNAAGVISEAADTRSWETLPDRIYVADFQLAPGKHTLRALFQDAAGTVLYRHDFPEIDGASRQDRLPAGAEYAIAMSSDIHIQPVDR